MTAFAPVVAVIALGVAVAACGPSPGVGDDDDAEGTAESSSTTSAGSGPSTTSPGSGPSTTSNPTVATSVSDSSSETLDTTSDDDDVTDDEGAAFYGGAPDGGGVSIECDVWAQDCMDGEKCMPWANDGGERWNATRCTPLDPTPAAQGDPCQVEGSPYSGIDDCGIAMMCWDVDPLTNQGTCAAFCSGGEVNPLCEDPATQCMIEYDGVVPICIVACDPLLQDCIATSSCVPASDAFFCVPDQSGAAGFYGDGCETFDACDPGYFCADPELVPGCVDVGCCTAFCDVSQDPLNACGNVEGIQCVPWYDEGTAPPGYELFGACVVPS